MTDAGLKEGDNGYKPPHSIPRLLLLGVMWCFTLLGILFSSLGSLEPVARNTGLFLNTTGNAYVYYLEIAPATWAFAVWGFIYVYQVIFLVYVTSTVFRRCGNSYLFYTPNFLPPSLYMVYTFNMVCNVIWIFLWDRQQPLAALFFLCLLAFTLYVAIVISIHSLHKHHADLQLHGHPREHRYVIGMVHNALGIYATWCTIATLLNFCNVVVQSHPVLSQEIASSASLSILAFEIMLYMLIDLGWWEKYTRFLWTPYFVLAWALAASLQRNFSPAKPNSVITLALLLAVIFFAVLKLILVIYREKHRPAFGNVKIIPTTEMKTVEI